MHLQFENHFENNYQALRSFALKLTRNGMDADDLVQETAIKAYRNFHRFMDGSSFKNWTMTILKNTFITKYHNRKKSKVISKPIEEMMYLADSTTHLSNSVAELPTMKQLHSCIDNLSDKSKDPFLLYINGYQYTEIAEVLDIPMGTVKSRINYARQKLKGMITKLKSYK